LSVYDLKLFWLIKSSALPIFLPVDHEDYYIFQKKYK